MAMSKIATYQGAFKVQYSFYNYHMWIFCWMYTTYPGVYLNDVEKQIIFLEAHTKD
jgi:hypothetical protein